MAPVVCGLLGHDVVAGFRSGVGRAVNSAALNAHGYYWRTEGLTSLAGVAGAIGVRLGFPLADPLIGLLITIAIFGIVCQSAKAVLPRMLDGVHPDITAEIRPAADHTPTPALPTTGPDRYPCRTALGGPVHTARVPLTPSPVSQRADR